MLKRLLIALAIGQSAICASANAADFQVKFKDNQGIEWSQVVGAYSNGCADIGVIMKERGDNPVFDMWNPKKCTLSDTDQIAASDSAAAQACAQIGGNLPSKGDYESLIRQFPHTETQAGPQLTSNGKTQMFQTFGDFSGLLAQSLFWTTQSSSDDVADALGYLAFDGKMSSVPDTRNGRYPTRCVRKSTPSS